MVLMGSGDDKRWFHVLRDRILGDRKLSESAGDDTAEDGAEVQQPDSGCDRLQDAPPAPEAEDPLDKHVTYSPPPAPEPAPPQVLGQVSDSTSMMYIQTCFWVASYVKLRAERGDFTEDQLIEQFGVNVRRCIHPEWKADA